MLWALALPCCSEEAKLPAGGWAGRPADVLRVSLPLRRCCQLCPKASETSGPWICGPRARSRVQQRVAGGGGRGQRDLGRRWAVAHRASWRDGGDAPCGSAAVPLTAGPLLSLRSWRLPLEQPASH